MNAFVFPLLAAQTDACKGTRQSVSLTLPGAQCFGLQRLRIGHVVCCCCLPVAVAVALLFAPASL